MPDTTPLAVRSCHELLLWLLPQLDKFPRVRRFTLGERLEVLPMPALTYLTNSQKGQQFVRPVADDPMDCFFGGS